MSGSYDDELSRPLEGALEASTSEGASSPAVGRDEWVARHGGNRIQRGGPLGALEERLRTVPWWAWLTVFVALFSLGPGRLRQRLRTACRIRHRHLHAARPRAERRRRVGRPTRSRLCRVLRHRRLQLRAAELRPLRHPPAERRLGPAGRRDRGGCRLPRRLAVAASFRGLPRDRDPLLPPALSHGDDQRRRLVRPQCHRRRERDPQGRPIQRLRACAARFDRRRSLQPGLSLRCAGVLRRGLRCPSLRQPLPDRPCLAVAARGSARRGSDGHARQLAEADELLLRRRDCGPDRDARNGSKRQRVPALVRVPAADQSSTRW